MVLVVDENADTREALVRLLQLAGREAIALAHGAQLLLFIQTHPSPELIILDIDMPHRDGIGVLRALRADARQGMVPVVVFSADDRPGDEAMHLGARAYVVKGSMDWANLSEQIDRLANGGGGPDQRVARHPQRSSGRRTRDVNRLMGAAVECRRCAAACSTS
jgi:CheY-like chemotaxis protein